MKKLFADFKKFITRGNVVDMAVGVAVAGAFKDRLVLELSEADTVASFVDVLLKAQDTGYSPIEQPFVGRSGLVACSCEDRLSLFYADRSVPCSVLKEFLLSFQYFAVYRRWQLCHTITS